MPKLAAHTRERESVVRTMTDDGVGSRKKYWSKYGAIEERLLMNGLNGISGFDASNSPWCIVMAFCHELREV
jgi:hypothetical protein